MTNEKIELSGTYEILIKGRKKLVILEKGNYKYEDCSDGQYIYGYLADYGYGLYMVADDPFLQMPSNDARFYRYGKFKFFELTFDE